MEQEPSSVHRPISLYKSIFNQYILKLFVSEQHYNTKIFKDLFGAPSHFVWLLIL